MKEQFRNEELSKAIDALNSQQPFTTKDEEVQKLLSTAAYVKKYGKSAQESAIINRLSRDISNDLAARRRKKRWYSAVAGIAAAAFLIFNVTVQLPSDLNDKGQPITPQMIAEQTTDIAAEQPLVALTPNADKPESVSNSVNKAKTNQGITIEQPNEPVAKQNTNNNEYGAARMEQAQQDKPVSIAKIHNSGGERVLMVLPGRKAETVSEESGVIKHIYDQGTDNEIIVTQRPKTESPSKPAASQSVSVMKAKDASKVNRATRSVNGVEIVVEGKQSQTELEQVAQSLISTKSTESQQAEANAEATTEDQAGN